ncbi:MAG: hypothetical protein NT042_14400 [Sulfuritalea sp.]|nr:hypothetical protein [Sulfuritalea sp.]
MKRTDIAKNLGIKIEGRMKQTGTPGRIAGSAVLDRKEQRKLDQARGLIPFAIKLDAQLVGEIRALAESRQTDLNELVAELLHKGLGGKD